MAKKAPTNRYGVTKATLGKPNSYTPDEWQHKFLEYLKHQGEKVWNKQEAIKSGMFAGKLIDIPVSAPLSIESFCVYAGIARQTFYNYESGKPEYSEYLDITTRMREIIEDDQLEGATLGFYNPNIIARRLGLIDKKQEVPTEEVDLSGLSDEELIELSRLQGKAVRGNE